MFTTRPPDAIAPGETAVVKLPRRARRPGARRAGRDDAVAPPGGGRPQRGRPSSRPTRTGRRRSLQFDRHSHRRVTASCLARRRALARSLPNLLEALKRALLRVYRRLQATGLAGLGNLDGGLHVLGPQAGALAWAALSPEVRAILGDAVNVGAAAASTLPWLSSRTSPPTRWWRGGCRCPSPRSSTASAAAPAARRWARRRYAARARDDVPAALPMKPGSGRHFAGGCPSCQGHFRHRRRRRRRVARRAARTASCRDGRHRRHRRRPRSAAARRRPPVAG